MKKFILFSSLLTAIPTLFSQSGYSPETLQKIKEVEDNVSGWVILNDEAPISLEERMKRYHVKGMSIAVIEDYKIAWAKGYGWADEGEKKPVTAETLFEPGSISKSLNAVGILKLTQENKLGLYTDINTYLTSWKFPYDSLSNGKKITLADILSHNAGLSVHGFPGHNINGEIPSVIQVLDGKYPAVTPAVRSEFEPGLKFQYSGGGTTISQLILTDITGEAYETWMYENVLKPIGMTHSSYKIPVSSDNLELNSSAYYPDGSPVLNKFHVYPEQAAAGLWMTPSDLCNYIIDMQLAYKGGTSKVLTQEMVKLHLTPYNNGPTAMGTFIEDHDGAIYFEHGAGNDGFCGEFFGSLEDGNGVVIFLNNESGNLLYDVINSVAKVYNWKNFYQEPLRKKTKEPITVSNEVISNYKGIYLYDGAWAGIEKKDNEYSFYSDGRSAKMYFTTPTCFFNMEFLAVKEFIMNENGDIIGYTRTSEGKEYPSSRKIGNPDTLKLDNHYFSEIGWYLFDHKEYKEALSYFKRGVELYPDDFGLLMNLAHLYLYNNDHKKAMAIYKAHMNNNVRPNYSWAESLKTDYIYFTDHHYDVTVFDKVFKELKIDKPKGY